MAHYTSIASLLKGKFTIHPEQNTVFQIQDTSVHVNGSSWCLTGTDDQGQTHILNFNTKEVHGFHLLSKNINFFDSKEEAHEWLNDVLA